jgi:hypothetical protein
MNMENIKEKLKQVVKQVSLYTIILISLGAGISIGYYYDFIKNSFKRNQPISVKRNEVKLAIDESNHLLVIHKKDGTYTVYQDSVGYMIFNLYAKNIWGQAANPKTQTTTNGQ